MNGAKSLLCVVLTVVTLSAGACSPVSLTQPKIDRQPPPLTWSVSPIDHVPMYNPSSEVTWQVDLRHHDLTQLDLTQKRTNLLYASFDTATRWPPASSLPPDYVPARILELGKNPGLGVRKLHTQGITGRGVGIAIIDETLLVNHQEYRDRLRLYEEIDGSTSVTQPAVVHGAAVASIAVGKTVGVAPEADLYFISLQQCSEGTYETVDFACLAKGVWRILEINRQLPAERKIRVLALAIGWSPEVKGYQEIVAATKAANDAGMLVVCSSMKYLYRFKFQGLGREPFADPDAFSSYEPGLWWAPSFYGDEESTLWIDRLMVPMDSRSVAGPGGTAEYVFYREGGWSWSIPYIAGVYALAVQVDPSITPEQFWALALKTSRSITLQHDGKTYELQHIIDPVALITEVR